MKYASLAAAYAGAELALTPPPHDPTGKLELDFEATHAGYLDSTGDVDVWPEEEPAPEEPEEPVEPPPEEPEP